MPKFIEKQVGRYIFQIDTRAVEWQMAAAEEWAYNLDDFSPNSRWLTQQIESSELKPPINEIPSESVEIQICPEPRKYACYIPRQQDSLE